MVWMGFLKISTYYWCSFQQTYKQCDSLHLNLNHHQISPISMSLPPNEPLESTFVPLQSNSNPAQWWCSCITSPITSVLNAQQQQLPSTLKKKKKKAKVLRAINNALCDLVHHWLSGLKSYFFFLGHSAPVMLSSLMFTRHVPNCRVFDWLFLQLALLFPGGVIWFTSSLLTLQSVYSLLFSPCSTHHYILYLFIFLSFFLL